MTDFSFPLLKGHFDDIKARVLKLPYQGERQAMIVLLPDNDDLDKMIDSLDSNSIARIAQMDRLKNPSKIKVVFPKYKHRTTTHLTNVREFNSLSNFEE